MLEKSFVLKDLVTYIYNAFNTWILAAVASVSQVHRASVSTSKKQVVTWSVDPFRCRLVKTQRGVAGGN